jgi:hypothetical protein
MSTDISEDPYEYYKKELDSLGWIGIEVQTFESSGNSVLIRSIKNKRKCLINIENFGKDRKISVSIE